MTRERVNDRHTRGVQDSTIDGDGDGTSQESSWLSVVTPIKDGLSDLARTWESLQVQDLTGVEWVIIDSSRDADQVSGFLDGVVGVPVTYRSQEPCGIFTAMNLGITEAAGQYVYFLNAGDTLADAESLALLRTELATHNYPAWAYADVEMVDDQGRAHVPAGWDHSAERSRSFARGHFPCHQGTVVRSTVIRSLGGFDTSYAIGGDYDLFLRLDRLYPPVQLPFTLARFAPGGASSQGWFQGLREFHRARRRQLRPTGWRAVTERIDTVWWGSKTVLYRSLWAPGKPLHGVVRRIRD